MTLTVEPHLRCHAEAVSRQEDFVASDPPPDHTGSPNRLWPGQRPKEESRSWHTPFGSRAYLIPFSVKFGSLALRISIQRHAAVVTARTAVAASWRVEGICSKLRASRSASLEAKTRKEPFCLSRLTNVTCIQHIYRYPDLSIFWGASIHVPRSKNPCAEFHYPCHPYGEVGNSTVRYSL